MDKSENFDQYPARWRANYTLGLLVFAYIISFVDRQILSFLVGPIRNDFQISDFQFSLLHGMAFALFYTFLGLPLGRLADSSNRTSIIIAGVFLWSIMTGVCGLASSFAFLFIARMGVGVGEATLSPSAYSLLTDLYPPSRLARAIAVFTMGITIGGGMAYIIGGSVYSFFENIHLISIPIIGEVKAWQLTFFVVALPGLLIAGIMFFTMQEPQRLNRMKFTTEGSNTAIPLKAVMRYMYTRRKVYASIIIGVSFMSIIGYATMAWYPEFLLRTYGMSKSTGGILFGTIFIIAGTAGTIAGAWCAEKLSRAGYEDANMRMIMLAALGLFLPAVIGPLMPSASLALLVAIPNIFIFYMHFGVAIAGLQIITPNQMRAQVSAVLLFFSNIFGLGMGGTIVAFLTDYVFQDDNKLNYSLSVVGGIMCPAVALIIYLGLKHYRKAISESGDWEAGKLVNNNVENVHNTKSDVITT